MECLVRLEFHGVDPQLLRVDVRRESGENLTSVRGKTSGAMIGAGSFQWTNAVKALCSILLRCAAIRDGEALVESVKLSGFGGSHAATLDYALSKEPLWTLDMFGMDGNGHSYLRRLLLRTNRERKYPGPVIVALNTRLLRPEHIEVWWNDKKAESSTEIESLLSHLEVRGAEEGLVAKCA